MRHTRYQGAIVQDDKLLLIRYADYREGISFWLIPGGGREADESEFECVVREMLEETNLEVDVERLLLESPAPDVDSYEVDKTYLCRVIGGQASPGHEPGEDPAHGTISEVGWFDLRSEQNWEASIFSDSITYPLVQEIRRALGYM
jgi:8-oxo-dGTP pyrophosphatase MutT (NUDIX family)